MMEEIVQFLASPRLTLCDDPMLHFQYIGIPAEHVGTAAAEELLKSIRNEACVDEHLQDQVRSL